MPVALAQTKIRKTHSIHESRLFQHPNIDSMRTSNDDMRKDINVNFSRSLQQAIERQNYNKHAIHYKTDVWDYLLLTRTHGLRTKMSTDWIRLHRISLLI